MHAKTQGSGFRFLGFGDRVSQYWIRRAIAHRPVMYFTLAKSILAPTKHTVEALVTLNVNVLVHFPIRHLRTERIPFFFFEFKEGFGPQFAQCAHQ